MPAILVVLVSFRVTREEIIKGTYFFYMGYIRRCSPKGNGFSAVLVMMSILAIFIINGVWFCTLLLNWKCFFRRS